MPTRAARLQRGLKSCRRRGRRNTGLAGLSASGVAHLQLAKPCADDELRVTRELLDSSADDAPTERSVWIGVRAMLHGRGVASPTTADGELNRSRSPAHAAGGAPTAFFPTA